MVVFVLFIELPSKIKYSSLIKIYFQSLQRRLRDHPPPLPMDRIFRNRAAPPPVEKKSCLQRLSLRGYRKITDRGLEYLKHLNMDLLDLTYTTVTKDGIENFLVTNPNCRIIHPLYCVCKPIRPC